MRTRDGKPLVRHYLSEWGHDYPSIQSWREQNGATERRGLLEFFAAHGICADCAGAGVDPVEEESSADPVFDLCLTCNGTGRAERSTWGLRARQIYVRAHGGVGLPYHSHESHGFSVNAIKEWRSVRHEDGRERSLRDFYIAYSLCPECRGEGVLMVGRGELSIKEKAERPWHDPDDDYPVYERCTRCLGSGRAALH